jgi:hypothetical protein
MSAREWAAAVRVEAAGGMARPALVHGAEAEEAAEGQAGRHHLPCETSAPPRSSPRANRAYASSGSLGVSRAFCVGKTLEGVCLTPKTPSLHDGQLLILVCGLVSLVAPRRGASPARPADAGASESQDAQAATLPGTDGNTLPCDPLRFEPPPRVTAEANLPPVQIEATGDSLARIFEITALLLRGRASAPVRIAVYGDSNGTMGASEAHDRPRPFLEHFTRAAWGRTLDRPDGRKASVRGSPASCSP